MTYTVIWEFRVNTDKHAEFERIYAGDGDWAKLFALTDGFLSTQLLADSETADRYLTIDQWKTPKAFEAFKSTYASEYDALDSECEGLTESEIRIGAFSSPDL